MKTKVTLFLLACLAFGYALGNVLYQLNAPSEATQVLNKEHLK